MALAFALALIARRTRWRWAVLLTGMLYVLSVGFSRVYLGVHYPSGDLGGWALAITWLIALSALGGPLKPMPVPTL